MASVTTYTCDRCGDSSTEFGHVHRVGVFVYVGHSLSSYSSPTKSAEWCRACLVASGLYPAKKHAGEKAPDPPPTFEDLVTNWLEGKLEELGVRRE